MSFLSVKKVYLYSFVSFISIVLVQFPAFAGLEDSLVSILDFSSSIGSLLINIFRFFIQYISIPAVVIYFILQGLGVEEDKSLFIAVTLVAIFTIFRACTGGL
ncbi:hypothetical protein [Synechococcus elongatus]|uniref:hypothetical protein n=1 Tax=Synechococcus elongatus TaxID=32046 RepID=UPI0030D2B761